MQDIIKLIQNRLWDEEELVKFMDKHDMFLFEIQNLVFISRSALPPFGPSLEELFSKQEFQELFLKLRTILKNETGTNPDGISDKDLYTKIVFPIGVFTLYPEKAVLNTVHRN